MGGILPVLAVGVLSFVVFFLREPNTLLHAQFWAEDGTVWYQTAYDHHFNPLTIFLPYAGYLGIFPRLVAVLSGLVDLKFVPLFFNFLALIIQILPVVYLWSRRFRKHVPNIYARLLITFLYLCIPYTDEIHGTITNSQWYLALLSFLLIFIEEAKNNLQKALERALLLIACLSGPFSIILLPILAYDWWKNKTDEERRGLKARLMIVAAAAIIQAAFLIDQHFHQSSRGSGIIGFDMTYLFRIFGAQVFGSGLFGYRHLQFFFQNTWLAPAIALVGLELLAYVFIKAPRILKFMIIYSFLVLIAALATPSRLGPGATWWGILSSTGGISRYYFLMHVAVFYSLVWLVIKEKMLWLRTLAALILISSIAIGIPADFVHPKLPDMQFSKYISKFENLNKGQKETIPINPGGPFWKLTLERR